MGSTLARWLGRRRGSPFVRRADLCRDRADWPAAASLYLQGHGRMPWRNDLLVQAGNCRKEMGDFPEAVELYRRAAQDPKQRAEADRQIGDVDAVVLRRWRQGGRSDPPGRGTAGDPAPALPVEPSAISGQVAVFPDLAVDDLGALGPAGPVRDMAMDPLDGRPLRYRPGLCILQIGNFRLAGEGRPRPLLIGVVALRITLIAYSEIAAVSVSFGDGVVLREPVALVRRFPDGRSFHIANIWIDTARHGAGPRVLRVEAVCGDGTLLDDTCAVTIAPVSPTFRLPLSDAFVPSPTTAYDDLADEVAGRPATVRGTRDMVTGGDVGSVLAVRIDQLGDLSASLPALRRLRELFPRARLTAVVATGLSGIVAASDLVDEVIGLTTAYDAATGRRHLDRAEAQDLRGRLAGRVFDIAIDLCPNPESRHLLLLADARCRVGFYPQHFPFLDFGVDIVSRDKANDHSTQSHASLVLSLVETLNLKMRALLPPVPRHAGDDGALLAEHGLRPGRYVAIHCGARHPINRWPVASFLELSRALAEHTGLEIVLFLDEDQGGDRDIPAAPGVSVIRGRLPVERLDALLSHAHAVIGNDSGPKHLAAVRGTWTASLHINRLNWSEWGQNGRGIVISKKTPCGGCGLNDERLCGKEVACLRSITVDQVFAALVDAMPAVAAGPEAPGR